VTLSLTAIEYMSSLADELAQSGKYRGYAEIERELRDRGYPEAEEWLFNTTLRHRLSSMCDHARAGRDT
jgi:hypothetical protein